MQQCSNLLNTLLCIFWMLLSGNTVSQMDRWEGSYSYSEEPVLSSNGEYSAVMVWELTVEGKSAKLVVNGMQTEFVFVCTVVENHGLLEVRYERSEGEAVMAPEVEMGERLLSLEMEGNNLITHWNSLRPRLNQEMPETGMYFTKNE